MRDLHSSAMTCSLNCQPVQELVHELLIMAPGTDTLCQDELILVDSLQNVIRRHRFLEVNNQVRSDPPSKPLDDTGACTPSQAACSAQQP